LSENRKIDFIRNQEGCIEVGESLRISEHRRQDHGRQLTYCFSNLIFYG